MNQQFPNSIRIFVFSLLALGIFLLALGGYIPTLTRAVLTPLTSSQTWISQQFQGLEDFISAPRDVAAIRRENENLEAENARLEAQIIELQQQLLEFEILSALLDFARAQPEHTYLGPQSSAGTPAPSWIT